MEDVTGKYRVVKEYQSPYPSPVVFEEGECVEIGKEFTEDPDWQNWIWCEGKGGKCAWVPVQYLLIKGETGTFRKSYNALELSLHVGEALIVNEQINGFGMAEKADGQKGWVPMRNLVEE